MDNMEYDVKKEARKQYLHYFRFWFLGIGILAVCCLALGMVKKLQVRDTRTNHEAPEERVYDYADVLTDEEEEKLRRHIAKTEAKLKIDIVLVTIDYSVEGSEAMAKYGLRHTDWEGNMQDIADDFFDEKGFGYNKSYEGDGVLLLHNWYPGQNGETLSTSGSVEWAFGYPEIDAVFDAVDRYYERDPYRAYKAYVEEMDRQMGHSLSLPFSWGAVIVLPIVIAFIYAVSNSSQKKAEKTVAVNAYVAGGKPELKGKSDELLRKSVATRKIETSSGGHSGGSRSGGSSGGGGHHHSSSGASHGGGSRRH